jgi:formamidopyrimidine-DNA glycosylase
MRRLEIMPELPEVETTRRGIAPYLQGQRIAALRVREPRLRWPVAEGLDALLSGRRVLAVERRAKYLLLRLERGSLILHLGMSGSLRVLPADAAAGRHDHLDLVLDTGRCLRLRDPRRFGALLWWEGDPASHPLLRSLGPEPLGDGFDGGRLFQASRGRRVAVKHLIMDSRVVAGVGNIYANEALFQAGIRPQRRCDRIAAPRYARLAEAVRGVLSDAIALGGTSLRDFSHADGSPGYFALSLKVYGRAGEPCPGCGAPIRRQRIGQRSSFFCPVCQR